MSTVPANEPTILVSGHLCKIRPDETIRAIDNQDGIGQHPRMSVALNCLVPPNMTR
jgi:hypothetical protein